MKKRVSLKQAVEFHGHLGPYLALGLLIGEYGLPRINARKHFGVEAKAWGVMKRPKSCLIDGLQLSTGCTYGKGNITKSPGKDIKVVLKNLKNNKSIKFSLKAETIKKLDSADNHYLAEKLAREFHKTKPGRLFDIE